MDGKKSSVSTEDVCRCGFENSAVGIAFKVVQGPFLNANKRFCELLGVPPEQLDTLTLEEITHPDDLAYSEEVLGALMRGEIPFADYEKRYLRPDGSVFWASVTVSPCGSLPDGTRILMLMLQDIDHRKHLKVELEHSERLFRFVTENMTDVVWILDYESRRFRYVSPSIERLRGFTPEEIMARPFEELLAPAARECLIRALNERVQAFITGQTTQDTIVTELEQPCKNGSSVRVEISARLFRNPENERIEILGVSRDITERLKAQEERRHYQAQLLQAQKLESLGVMAGGIAHDFNNLLLAILGNAELARIELPAGSPAQDNLAEILKVTQRAAELCRQMLAYSGKGRMLTEPVDLSATITGMTKLFEAAISKKVRIELDLSAALPAVEADVAQLRQVVMSLVRNASEAFGDREGTICIRTGRRSCDAAFLQTCVSSDQIAPGEFVFLEITDNAAGMDQATRARIFDPFFSTRFTGRGLGLSASLGVIKSHRGAVLVQSELGKGSTFLVLLPMSEKTVPQAAGPFARDLTPRGKVRILLVDDEEDVRFLAKRVLGRAGYEVVEARDGLEAVRIFGAEGGCFDCVLLDLKMPKLDGIETFVELHRLRSDVNVVLSSGYDGDVLSDRPEVRGIAGFLQKPYSNEDLVEKIRFILDQRRKRGDDG